MGQEKFFKYYNSGKNLDPYLVNWIVFLFILGKNYLLLPPRNQPSFNLSLAFRKNYWY